jgi:hypothetical protein
MALTRTLQAYDPNYELPLGGYATLVSMFGAALGTALIAAKPRAMHVSVATSCCSG